MPTTAQTTRQLAMQFVLALDLGCLQVEGGRRLISKQQEFIYTDPKRPCPYLAPLVAVAGFLDPEVMGAGNIAFPNLPAEAWQSDELRAYDMVTLNLHIDATVKVASRWPIVEALSEILAESWVSIDVLRHSFVMTRRDADVAPETILKVNHWLETCIYRSRR